MNAQPQIAKRNSVCPHDCPSCCALEVEVIDGSRIGRVRGARSQSYTDGVICAKVARYAERIHHPDRLTHPMRRVGAKGEGRWERISWDEALDEIAARFLEIEAEHGAEAVWPYYYAGTMGFVQRDGINRLRHAKKYSRFHSTICTTMAWTGFAAGTGKVAGADPREMALSDCVVIWGTNAVATQVNVMHHAAKARKARGAKIVVIDIYRNATVQQADLGLVLRPGTDGALACGVMHVLFRDGYADREYLRDYTDAPEELEAHLATRTPEWAAEITGLSVAEIEAFARLVGETKRTYFRLGYGFTRQRNGAANMHAALCIPAVTGAWKYEGGGAFHNNDGIFHLNKSAIEGHDAIDPSVRVLDQSQIGRILTGDAEALRGGGPVKALLVQNTNPVSVAPEQALVRRGFAREDLFVAVHEQFMTETAEMADIVLPATQFMEHDDLYRGGGHQFVMFGPKLIDGPDECRDNHFVICELAKRLGAEHEGFGMTARELVDRTLRNSGTGRWRRWRRRAGSTCSRNSGSRIISTGSPGRTGSSGSSRTGRGCRMRTPAARGPGGTCPPCPTTGTCWRRRTRRIRSSSRPRRRGISSIRPSPRRRGRRRGRGALVDDPPRGRRRAGRGGGGRDPDRQRAGRDAARRAPVRGGEARGGDRRGHLAQPRPQGRLGDQRTDGGRQRGPLWRRGLP